MAAVAITVQKSKKLEDNRLLVNAKLVFGDGSTTYPAGGIAVQGKFLGMPRFVDSLMFSDASNGDTKQYKWDSVNQKVRIYVEGASVYAEMTGVIPSLTVYVQAIGSK